MTLLRAWAGARVRRQLLAAVMAPGVAIVALVAAYIAVTGHDAADARWLALGAAIFLVIRLSRTVLVYTGMLAAVDEDKEPSRPRPNLDDLPGPVRAAAGPQSTTRS